jgi:hypothetical protein
LTDWAAKTPELEFVRKFCTEPSRMKKEKALRDRDFAQANLAAMQENACRIIENNFKAKKKEKNTTKGK